MPSKVKPLPVRTRQEPSRFDELQKMVRDLRSDLFVARHNLLHLMDAARSLRSPEALAQRKLILLEPRMAPLRKYVNGLRAKYALAEREFPDFDPMDGACQARILLLLEKPGPMTSAAAGNGSGSPATTTIRRPRLPSASCDKREFRGSDPYPEKVWLSLGDGGQPWATKNPQS